MPCRRSNTTARSLSGARKFAATARRKALWLPVTGTTGGMARAGEAPPPIDASTAGRASTAVPGRSVAIVQAIARRVARLIAVSKGRRRGGRAVSAAIQEALRTEIQAPMARPGQEDRVSLSQMPKGLARRPRHPPGRRRHPRGPRRVPRLSRRWSSRRRQWRDDLQRNASPGRHRARSAPGRSSTGRAAVCRRRPARGRCGGPGCETAGQGGRRAEWPGCGRA